MKIFVQRKVVKMPSCMLYFTRAFQTGRHSMHAGIYTIDIKHLLQFFVTVFISCRFMHYVGLYLNAGEDER
jgi:hypothetical protein